MRTLITAGTIVMALSIVSFDADARRPQQAKKTTQCSNQAIHGSGSAYRVASTPAKDRWGAHRARAAKQARRAAVRRTAVNQRRRRAVAGSPYAYGRKVVRVKRRPTHRVVQTRKVIQLKRRPVRKSAASKRYVVSSNTPRIAFPAPVRIILALR